MASSASSIGLDLPSLVWVTIDMAWDRWSVDFESGAE